MSDRAPSSPEAAVSRTFARKVRLSLWALFFERLWPRLWLLIGLAILFVILSFAGVWPRLSPLTHQIVLALFAIAGLVALGYAARVPWPSRDDAIRRIERRSGVPHRPATSYEDTLTSGGDAAPETAALWQAHRQRLARAIERLRVGTPSPRADRFDPFAVRALALLALASIALLATGSLSDKIASAFRISAAGIGTATRLDAWVTPPPYTALPPILLADGAAAVQSSSAKSQLLEVPENALLTLRGNGFGQSGVALEILEEGASQPVRVDADPPKSGDKAAIAEARYEIKKSARVRALSGATELAQWTFDVIVDELPKIELIKDKPLSATPRGSLKLAYKGEDDYGIASAEAKVRPTKKKQVEDARSWAKPKPLKGPRLPLEPPPELALKVPRPGAKTLDASTLLELAEHPWAGKRVEMWLEATDVGGRVGRSAPVEIVLPARQFKKPLARAVIEQRGKLLEDSRYRPDVVKALDALTLEPEGFIESASVFLGLRDVYHRLGRDGSRAAMRESVGQLWHLALLIEDGKLSEAERALKDVQDRLAEALQKGADDNELQQLMAELRQKLSDYLNEMQKNAQKDNPESADRPDQQNQPLGQQDLEQMLQDLEKNARDGSREDAEKMLSELRELMDRLQAGNTPEARAEQQRAQEMMRKLNQLGDLAGKQRQLMDDTFSEQRRRDGEAQRGGSEDDNSGQQSRNRERGQGQQQGGQEGQGQSAEQQGGGQQGQGQQGQGQGQGERQRGKGDLQDRQAELRRELERLKKELENMGAGDPERLGNAEDAMGRAEDALRQGDLDEASQQQAEALDQMRQSAEQMAEQMQRNTQRRLGRGGDSPRDPLGRPQRSEGPDLGNSVKVPDAIDAQRAREILDELRKRSGENLRPPVELDYIDRLLRRF
jgi:uncharacterized protein (TIGR02302 family)